MLSISQVAFSRWHPSSILKSSVIAVETEEDLSSPLLGVVFGGPKLVSDLAVHLVEKPTSSTFAELGITYK